MNAYSIVSRPAFAMSAVVLAMASTFASMATAAQQGSVGCLIAPSRVADIGTTTAGVIDRIHVDRGDAVRKGQALATLRADVERASLAAAQVRVDAEADVAGAQAAAKLARQKLDRAKDLFRQQFISAQALEQASAEEVVAAQALQHALDQRAVYRSELEQARAQLGLRTLSSPIDGIVVDRMVHPGERVELQPLLRVADVSELRVEVVVPVSQYGRISEGMSVSVQAEVPTVGARMAKVSQVDRMIDAASDTFRVRLVMPNPNRDVPAGARCRVSFAGGAPVPPSNVPTNVPIVIPIPGATAP